jgi:hypothetical protein
VFVLYGVIYGYVGISAYVLPHVRSLPAALAYVVVSGTVVIASLVVMSRHFGRES